MNKNTAPIVEAVEAIPYFEPGDLHYLPLSCEVASGQLLCLVGPHRAQLREYLRMLAGIYRPASGLVNLFGMDVHQDQKLWHQMRIKIGYLSGVAPLLSTQHGLMNVMIPALFHGNDSFRKTADKARQLLQQLHCDFDLLLFPALLGNLQRLQLSLARALILDPELLVLDVPFHDLGANERTIMAELLAQSKQQRSVCMIGGLQHAPFLEQYADQIIYISEQEIIKFGSWADFLESANQQVQSLMRGGKHAA